MRRALRLSAPLLLASLLAGCAPTATVEAFDQRMTTYIGRSETELVGGLGVPSQEQGAPVRVCTDPLVPVAEIWQRAQRLG